jgi:hypothetical protein
VSFCHGLWVLDLREICTQDETFDAGLTLGNPRYEMLLLHSDSWAGFEVADKLQSNTRRCLMSFRLLQSPPQASTRSMRVPLRWIELDGCMAGNEFLRSWLGDNNDSGERWQRLNWGALAGLAVSFVISGGFWTGVGLLLARALR